MYNVRVLDHFWPSVVPCLGTWYAVQIATSFVTILTTQNYNHNYLLRFCAFTQFLHDIIPVLTSSRIHT
jgi:hypothetical protein